MLRKYLEEAKLEIEKKTQDFLLDIDCPKTLSEGMLYSVLNGGKRIRPILLIMIVDMFKKEREIAYPSAVALELIHSYSLVHDDLPAMDNDDYRRGKLTTHKKFGEAEAILIGDSLLTQAFNVLSNNNRGIVEDRKIVDIIIKASEYAGVTGMIAGQLVDIESENKKIDIETLKYIHYNKTGKLLKLPIEIACILVDATDKERELLSKYGDLLGLAFQIKDDILDVEGDFENIGKATGSDEKLKKSTYPNIFGLEKSKEILVEIITEAKEILTNNFKDKNIELLLELTNYIKNRNK